MFLKQYPLTNIFLWRGKVNIDTSVTSLVNLSRVCPTKLLLYRRLRFFVAPGSPPRDHNARRHEFFFFFLFFICGAADRSGRGKRCSSSCCCWGGPFFSLPCAVFWGVKRQKTLSKKGCEKAKTLSKKVCDKAKTSSKILFSTPQISESIPFLFLLLLPPSVLPLSLCSAQQSLRPTFKKSRCAHPCSVFFQRAQLHLLIETKSLTLGIG